MEKQMYEAMGHFSKGFQVLTEAFQKAGLNSTDPKVENQSATSAAQATTAKAKKDADKKAAAPVAEDTKPEPQLTVAQKVEEKKPAAKKTAKPEAPDYESLDREGRIEHLREQMVLVSVKLQGDTKKVYSFLEKYGTKKVNQLSEQNLDNLKEDIEAFLGGPDALDI